MGRFWLGEGLHFAPHFGKYSFFIVFVIKFEFKFYELWYVSFPLLFKTSITIERWFKLGTCCWVGRKGFTSYERNPIFTGAWPQKISYLVMLGLVPKTQEGSINLTQRIMCS